MISFEKKFELSVLKLSSWNKKLIIVLFNSVSIFDALFWPTYNLRSSAISNFNNKEILLQNSAGKASLFLITVRLFRHVNNFAIFDVSFAAANDFVLPSAENFFGFALKNKYYAHIVVRFV